MSAFKRIRRGIEDKFYTVKWEVRGLQKTKRTPFTARAEAEKYLEKIKLAYEREEWAILQSIGITAGPAVETCSTIADLITAYQQNALDIKPDTRTHNIQALKLLLSKTLGDSALALQQPLTLLDANFVHRFKHTVETLARGQTELRAQQLKRSANSQLRQARSLFTRQLLALYPRLGLILPPSIDAFVKAPGFKRVQKTDYNPPNDALLARTFTDLTRLTCLARGVLKPEPTDPARHVALRIARAVWLTIAFGLRKSEISAAEHSWIIQRDGRTCIAGDKLTKNKDALDIICPFPNALPHLAALGVGAGSGFILEGTQTDRCELAFEDVSAWMRRLGWKTEKCIHEFRAWCGCQVAIHTGSLIAAQHFMRHASYQTTERNYGRYIRLSAQTITLQIPTVAPLKILNA